MYLPEPPAARHPDKVGILLTNLGTPDAPNARALRRYLAEFLSDKRVIELPFWEWQPILHGIILRRRPAQSAAKYKQIWRTEGSPLRLHSERQCQLLRVALCSAGYTDKEVHVEYGMRYGAPSISKAIEDLRAAGCGRLIVLPLYPQYSASTTGSSFDAVFRHMLKVRHVPTLTTISHFYDHPAYIAALRDQISGQWARHGRPDHLLLSFHGAPQQTHADGDPYFEQCQASAKLIAAALELDESEWTLSFQSRFGRSQWLQPYTTEVLKQLATRDLKRLDVICPAFVADCLETLEEMGITERDTYLKAGGKEYRLIPCLNETPGFIKALVEVVKPFIKSGGQITDYRKQI